MLREGMEYAFQSKGEQLRTAVLALDSERFHDYVFASARYGNRVLLIKSRDDVEQIRYSGKRVVLSTPEYVAGLQFERAILLDVNAELAPQGAYSGVQLRSFVSELYLGITRAEREVILLSSEDGNGFPDLVKRAVEAGLVVQN